jgi:large subunit ribosomal protein L28
MARRCDLLSVGVMSGNKVSHSNRKTRRKFYPNLRSIAFKSDVLGVEVKLDVAASTLRTINKYGNIDNFLINTRFAKLSDAAKKLRLKIKKKLIKGGKLEEVKFPKAAKEKKVVKKTTKAKAVKKSA